MEAKTAIATLMRFYRPGRRLGFCNLAWLGEEGLEDRTGEGDIGNKAKISGRKGHVGRLVRLCLSSSYIIKQLIILACSAIVSF